MCVCGKTRSAKFYKGYFFILYVEYSTLLLVSKCLEIQVLVPSSLLICSFSKMLPFPLILLLYYNSYYY